MDIILRSPSGDNQWGIASFDSVVDILNTSIVLSLLTGGPPPALALAAAPSQHTQSQSSSSSILDSIIDKGFLWGVPKFRVSAEKRQKRRNGWNKIESFATPRRNIVACLECGHYHEAHTICGKHKWYHEASCA